MAGEIPDLIAEARTGTGKGAARQARRESYVPGIVYGGGKDPQPINIKYNYLLKKLKAGRFLSTLFNLKVEGQEDVRVICRNVQRWHSTRSTRRSTRRSMTTVLVNIAMSVTPQSWHGRSVFPFARCHAVALASSSSPASTLTTAPATRQPSTAPARCAGSHTTWCHRWRGRAR